MALDGARFAGATAIIIGLIHAFFRFLRWAVEFSCGRLDMRSDRVGQREQDYEDKIEDRLVGLEAAYAECWEVVMALASALHQASPGNPELSRVAQLLNRGFPVRASDRGKDEDLIDKLKGVL